MLTFTAPEALWLLLALPLVWSLAWFGRSTFSRRQQWLQASVRSFLLTTLALALARPVLATQSNRIAFVFAVDVSHSISARAMTAAADRIDAIVRQQRPDDVRVIAFGSRVIDLADTAALRAIASSQQPDTAAEARRDGSDLEAALIGARTRVPAGDQPRIVLFSDGVSTGGDLERATERLARDGIPVVVEPMDVRDLGDAWVMAIDVPEPVPSGSSITVTPVIYSQRGGERAEVELREGGRVLARAQPTLAAGETAVPIDVTIERAGSHVIEAVLTVAGDPLDANNHLSREILAQPRGRVLYVEGAFDSAGYLQHALVQSGFDVVVRRADGLPTRAEDLEPWDAVIVSDVPRRAMSEASMRALADWVEHAGGGLLLAGGDNVFGEGGEPGSGYHGSQIERLLPVTIERKDEPQVAMVMVLDKSWSMAGTVMEICKAAAQAAVDALSDRQVVGVISFDDRLNWDVTPRPVGENRAAIRRAIAAIQPGGDTLIYPALEQAYLELRKVRAAARHVLLLSDGRSYPDDYEGLTKKMVAAGMTVSSVAVGREADAKLLSSIAGWGKGRAYLALNASDVPQIFVKEAKNAMASFEEGESIVPAVKAMSMLRDVSLAGMPALHGRTTMVLKESATEVLTTAKQDPILSWWPIGRGRTAAFAADVKDRWASDWIRWSGYAPLFSSVVRAIARPRPHAMTLEVTPGVVRDDIRTAALAIEARDSQGRYRNLLQPTIRIEADGVSPATVTARQTAPGRYEATVTADSRRTLSVSLMDAAGAVADTRHVVADPMAEYRFRPVDEASLRSVAAATGGIFQPADPDWQRIAASPQRTRRAIWPSLLWLACALWPVDILLRRARLFERPNP